MRCCDASHRLRSRRQRGTRTGCFGPLSSGESQRIAGQGTLSEPHCTDDRQVFPK